MVAVNFDIEPDETGAIDGLALARLMIASAYDHVMATLATKDNQIEAERVFNAVLLEGLGETLGEGREIVLAGRLGAADEEEIDSLLTTYRYTTDEIADNAPRFAGAALHNRLLSTIDAYRQVCRDARECIERLLILAGVDNTPTARDLFHKLDHAAYEGPVRLKPFPAPGDEEAFGWRPAPGESESQAPDKAADPGNSAPQTIRLKKALRDVADLRAKCAEIYQCVSVLAVTAGLEQTLSVKNLLDLLVSAASAEARPDAKLLPFPLSQDVQAFEKVEQAHGKPAGP